MKKLLLLLMAAALLTGCQKYSGGEPVNKPKEEKLKVEEIKKEEPKKELTLEDKVTAALHKGFGKKFNDKDSVQEIKAIKGVDESARVNVKVYAKDSIGMKTTMLNSITSTLKELQNENEIETIFFMIIFPLVDQYGNSEDGTIAKVEISKETLDKINFKNFVYNQIPNIADEYWEHPAVSK
ncbi:hypothetical protein F7731_08745 [Cytobacillus depressus]|uniref:Lipoprotein n=1 Tax=Cytobacillus depressus TaxID=1602942 RepID=A0A6L3VDU3_9BACI|nr:hypothetical protein [Cytobacillus depressus]KAB2337670.1 hypothetical protein F7731_08745 [Cytobacillus depressus]